MLYEFKYDISDLLRYGKENLLEVEISKRSSNESVNRAERYADYWIFGGIFRPNIIFIMSDKRHQLSILDQLAYAEIEHRLKAKLHEWMILNKDYLPLPIPHK